LLAIKQLIANRQADFPLAFTRLSKTNAIKYTMHRRDQKMKRVLTLVLAIVVLFQFNPLIAKASTAPELKAESAVLMEAKSGKVLYEKELHKQIYPASTTKILTAILVLENLDLDDTVTVGDEIKHIGLDSSASGLKIGETMSARDLMWALLLPSGNDAAYTAAVTVARKKSGDASMGIQESLSYFADMMNKKAAELGAKDTHFVNPDGYHDENHYTSAYDIALFSREAMKYDLFNEIVKTRVLETTAPDGEHRLWVNRNELVNQYGKYYYQFATGIKTGHTSYSGFCLAASASKSGMDLIAVVMKEPDEESRWLDTTALFEYGFNSFKEHTLFEKGQILGSVNVGKKYRKQVVSLDVSAETGYSDILLTDDISKIEMTMQWDPELLADTKNGEDEVKLLGPITQGQVVGKAIFTVDGKTITETNLISNATVMEKDIFDTFLAAMEQVYKVRYILVAIVAAILILVIVNKISSKKAKSKSSRW